MVTEGHVEGIYWKRPTMLLLSSFLSLSSSILSAYKGRLHPDRQREERMREKKGVVIAGGGDEPVRRQEKKRGPLLIYFLSRERTIDRKEDMEEDSGV
jgi:hypothetical protein